MYEVKPEAKDGIKETITSSESFVTVRFPATHTGTTRKKQVQKPFKRRVKAQLKLHTEQKNSVKVMTRRFLFKYYLNREILKMIHYKETKRLTEVNLIRRIQETTYRKTKQQRTVRSLT